MNLHEYQAKWILQRYGIPVPVFFVASSLEEVKALIDKHQLIDAVLKVQVHAGGRGKAGGVRRASYSSEILSVANELIGKKIINEQTGPLGMISSQILITAPVEIISEYYLGIIIDRQQGRDVLIASPEGGIDIEQIARESPEKILRVPIPFDGVLKPFHLMRIAKFMGWSGAVAQNGSAIVTALVNAFIETDATLIEINPLVLCRKPAEFDGSSVERSEVGSETSTESEYLSALDAKCVIDDSALFRHPELRDFFDPSQISPNEALAAKYELAYVGLDGTIGCMVNGAGLAMATMDLIQQFGGKPANFLDVGGGASKEKISEGFKIILSDPNVKAILINIFGGIMNCETLAAGIIAAANELEIHVPLIVRLEGTNVVEGKKLLLDSNLNLITANGLSEAAQKVVEAAKK
jgi:succinyl-CoA synthetase beta subunit